MGGRLDETGVHCPGGIRIGGGAWKFERPTGIATQKPVIEWM